MAFCCRNNYSVCMIANTSLLRFHSLPNAFHPYIELYSRAMLEHGIEVTPGMELSNRYLADHASAIDGIHLHWPEQLWQGRSLISKLRGLIGLVRYCRLARKLGKRVIWTVHNHES